jgi:hypothetical protein
VAAITPGFVTQLELQAFVETRDRHDAKRLANALRYVEQRHDLADELQQLLDAGLRGGDHAFRHA